MRLCSTLAIYAFAVSAVVAFTVGVQAAKPQAAPPDIPLGMSFNLSPQSGVYGEGVGPYIHGIDEVQAYVSGTCDIISFRTKDANWTSPRKLVFDFTGYIIDSLGIETATMFSAIRPQQNPCSNDLRNLVVNQSRTRYTYIHWRNAHVEYRLLWSDVQVKCLGVSGSLCSQWMFTPTSSAEVLNVVGVSRGQFQYESRGFYAMPFQMTATSQ